jgi:hypothetical protein
MRHFGLLMHAGTLNENGNHSGWFNGKVVRRVHQKIIFWKFTFVTLWVSG